jgi:predicted regulator of Ras-like GTPase activity (Roadblock/LC7/MglB family)
MIDERRSPGKDAIENEPLPTSRPPLRARAFKDIIASLAKVASIRGVLLVTPDGLVITTALPSRSPVEALAALGATLGRELELGSTRLGRGQFRMALFVADHGTLFVGASRIGFVILLGDGNAHVASVQAALAAALDRL